MQHSIINRTASSVFRYNGWPTVCSDENGVIYVGYSGHRIAHVCPFGMNLMQKSFDGGATWTNPIIVNDTILDDRDMGLLSLGKNRLLATWFNHPMEFYEDDIIITGCPDYVKPLYQGMIDTLKQRRELNDYGSFIKISNDGGNTWSEKYKVPVSSPHGPTRLSNGKLLYLGKEKYSDSYEKDAIMAFESADEGKTWRYLSTVGIPEECSKDIMFEPYAVQLSSGRILGAIRVEKSSDFEGFTVYTCYSDDCGLSWTMPKATGIMGSPPHMYQHSSGAVILSYGRRVNPPGECVRISKDGGETWGDEIMLMPLHWSNESFIPAGDMGYPSTIELKDGSLITVYYHRYNEDKFPSVLMTKWELPC